VGPLRSIKRGRFYVAKSVESLSAHWERLVSSFDFPAEHWKHPRTTNVIESPFATVRLRERATKGASSRTKRLLMAFKLLDMAHLRWRRLDGAGLLPLVLAGGEVRGRSSEEGGNRYSTPSDNARREAT
jgi:putative transposase